mmetsp:Transcript_27634/g.42551  ORF Transcript_27634/g.42551 Transcript_27634/m.42551 type:complete len:355 (-) Transcript_27634:128-1192(-)
MLRLPDVPSTLAVAIMSKSWNNEIPSSFPVDNSTTSNHYFPMTNDPLGGLSHRPTSNGSRSLFPTKLRQILDDSAIEGNQDIVSWLPHGRAFRVHKPKEFAAKIVGRYFNHGQYRSFTRQLYHYGFGKVDSGQDMGAFFHPQFLRDEPSLAFLIGRRKDTKKKSDEQGASDACHTKIDAISDHDSLTGFGMIESPFNALVDETSSRIKRAEESSTSMKERGITSLLHQLSSEDQEAMIKHFRSDTGGMAQLPVGSNHDDKSVLVDEEAGIGLLFGDDHHSEHHGTPTRMISQQRHTLEPNTAIPQQQQQDWFSSIGSFFEVNSFDNDVNGVDFEPRPIEEMTSLSSNRQNKDSP